MKRNNQGITLIALVITIIVLLILAGVTINLTLGEKGIFTTAQQAAKNYTNAQNRELAELGNFSNTVNDTINNVSYVDGEEFKLLSKKLQEGYTFEGETIKLSEDIDLSSITSWIPIGTEEYPFKGTFDGCGHKITNLKIETTESSQGLFGYNNGTIKNLGIESGTLNVGGNSGGIVGANYGRIENCYNKSNISCSVSSKTNIGGICGCLYEGTIYKCYNTGTITLNPDVGAIGAASGIVGFGRSGSNIISCYNSGNISNVAMVDWSRATGIVGGSSNVTSCYNSGNITLTKGDGYNGTACNVAGISSQLESNSNAMIRDCINYGKVTAESFSGRVAAICGILRDGDNIENCFYEKGSCDKGIFQCFDSESNHCSCFEDGSSDFDALEILGSDFCMKERIRFSCTIFTITF